MMRKLILNLTTIFVVLALTSSVYASVDTLVGRKIEKEVDVKVDGEPMAKKAILIDGTTYVPIRAVVEELGLDIRYVDGEVIIMSQSADKVIESKSANVIPEEGNGLTIGEIDSRLSEIVVRLEGMKIGLEENERRLREVKDLHPEYVGFYEQQINKITSSIQQLEDEMADLEQQKADLEARLQAGK